MPFGAFIEILPGKDGLLHVSEIDYKRIEKVEDVLKEGDHIQVKLLEVDPKTGKLRLSHKALLPKPEGYQERSERPRGDRNDRGERRERPERHDRGKDVNVPNVVNHGLKEQKTIRKPVVRNNGYEVIYRPEPVSVPGFFIGVCRGGIAPVLRFPAK